MMGHKIRIEVLLSDAILLLLMPRLAMTGQKKGALISAELAVGMRGANSFQTVVWERPAALHGADAWPQALEK